MGTVNLRRGLMLLPPAHRDHTRRAPLVKSLVGSQVECPSYVAARMSSRGGVLPCLPAGRQEGVPMQRGWLRVMVRYPLVVVEQGRLSQEEAAREMGLSTRRVRRVLKRYRESGQRLESLAYQRRHSAWNALPRSTKTEGVVVHRATVHRLLRREAGNPLPRHRRPARRFEMRAFGELWQMDTTVGAWLEGYRRACLPAGRSAWWSSWMTTPGPCWPPASSPQTPATTLS
jgi:transposase